MRRLFGVRRNLMLKKATGRNLALCVALFALCVIGLGTWAAWPHMRFWILFERLCLNEQGCREYRHRKTGIVFVRVSAQGFWMGSGEDETLAKLQPQTESGNPDEAREWEEILAWERPRRWVQLSTFLIAKYEMTQGAWIENGRAVSERPGYPGCSRRAELPLRNVSWREARDFCEEAGLTLPTEAQWECACRAGTEGPFAGTGDLDVMGWYGGNSDGTVHPVGRKSGNAWGLYDMHGNVAEYCLDFFCGDFYSTPAAAETDPLCDDGVGRAVRGGCFDDTAERCRSAARRFNDEPELEGGDAFVGFRPAFWPLP